GILVPAQVDRFTGYRMYTADQLADAAIVRRLRALDLPLEQVREVLQARDPDFTRQVLANHQVAMQARLAETERIVRTRASGAGLRASRPAVRGSVLRTESLAWAGAGHTRRRARAGG